MEQRTYHGNVSAEGLADYIIRHYGQDQGNLDPRHDITWQDHRDIQAQKIGKEGSFLVQIGHGKDSEHVRNIVTTIGIAQLAGEEQGIAVTMGQRQWITADELKNAAFWTVLAALITPFCLFGLLWPLSNMLSDTTLTHDIWNTVDVYAGSQGAVTTRAEILMHPHIG
jgi:hypothetical protein